MRFKLFNRNKPRTEAEVMQSIRETWAAFGYSLDEYTDEEIRMGILKFQIKVAKFGVTAAQANEAMRIGLWLEKKQH